MTRRKRDAARQSLAKAVRPKTNAEGTVGRRSLLKGAAAFAGGAAAGLVGAPLLGTHLRRPPPLHSGAFG